MIDKFASRQSALRAAFDSAIELIFEKFCRDLDDFEVVPLSNKGRLVGAILRNGPEIHVSVDPSLKGQWMTRDVLRYLKSVVDEHGYATTGANTKDGEEFVKRLGFVKEGEKYVLR